MPRAKPKRISTDMDTDLYMDIGYGICEKMKRETLQGHGKK